jgi:hypothetical protein
MELTEAIDAAVRAADKALAGEMRAADGQPAAPHLERMRRDLLAMRARGAVDPDELRHMIRSVAGWAPEDDVSLLAALGLIARATTGRTTGSGDGQ